MLFQLSSDLRHPADDRSQGHLSERPPLIVASRSTNSTSSEPHGFYLYESQGIEFNDLRDALRRLFGQVCSVTIHDGDACTLFDSVDGNYCAGTINDATGTTIATFAIDHLTEETGDKETLRRVVGVHVGPRGQWCRSLSDLDAYNEWVRRLSLDHPHE